MAEHPARAALRAVEKALYGNTVCGDNCHMEKVEQGEAKPYLVYRRATGGERNFHTRKGDPEYVIDVKCVANDLATALQGAQQAKELLDDKGYQDAASGALENSADWYILKAMVEGEIRQQYMVGTLTIYEEGFQLRVTMEAKSDG